MITVTINVTNPQELRALADQLEHVASVRVFAQSAPTPSHAEPVVPSKPAAPVARVCPDHQVAKPSKFGGIFCPRQLPDGSHCRWTAEVEEAA